MQYFVVNCFQKTVKSINLFPYDKPKDLPWGKRYEEADEQFSSERPPSDNINADLPYFLVKVPTLINQQNLEEIPFEPHLHAIDKGAFQYHT